MTRFAALLVFIVVLGISQGARAHAVLVEAVPRDGAVLDQAPAEVKLRFNEPVSPVMLRVVGADGKTIADQTQARADNDTLTLPLPSDLPNDSYVVTYRVISLDSHAVAGSLTFVVGDVPLPPEQRVATSNSGVVTALIVTRALFLAALLTAAGAILALWLLADFGEDAVRRNRRIVLASAVAALVLGAVSLGIAGCDFAGLPLAGFMQPAAWRLALSSSLAQSLAVAATGLVLLLVALPRLAHGSNRAVALAGSLIALGSFAVTGHAATAAPQWLMRWVVPLHALCAAFWVGALPVLLAAVRAQAPERSHHLLVRFSAYALATITLMVTLGVTIAIVQVRHLAMLVETLYGVALLGKLIAAVLLLAVAAHNKWQATPLFAVASASAKPTFARGVWAEYLLFAIILALTATLGETPPPRAIAARDAAGLAGEFNASREQDGYKVRLAVSPARVGHNVLTIEVADAAGQPVTPQEVTLEMSLPAADIEPRRRETAQDAASRFVYHGEDLTLAGRWRIDVNVLIDDFTKTVVSFDVPIR